MNSKLPVVIQKYVEASNRHDIQSILSCFSNDAVVHEEGETLRGKKAIESWIAETIEKYKFHFEPLRVRAEGSQVVPAIQVSRTFPGSPVTLNYQFKSTTIRSTRSQLISCLIRHSSSQTSIIDTINDTVQGA